MALVFKKQHFFIQFPSFEFSSKYIVDLIVNVISLKISFMIAVYKILSYVGQRWIKRKIFENR